MFNAMASTLPLVEAGELRALAVTTTRRARVAPDLPTIDESGLPGFQLEVWWGLLAPARTPTAVIKRLNDEADELVWCTLSQAAKLVTYDRDRDLLRLVASLVDDVA